MAIVQIDTDELLAKSRQVETSVGRLQTEVNTMESHLRQLEGTWKGQASENFQTLLSEWRAVQARVEESLSSIREAMSQAATQYLNTETSNASMFRG